MKIEAGTRISLEEQKSIQLQMLKEFDLICKSMGLRYSLAYGTLLGAIRHKGYIPWDDDVDIIMPLPDIERLKDGLNSEMLQIIDIENYKYYDTTFPRICHAKTYNLYGKSFKSYGINFDLYPIVGAPSDDEAIEDFLRKGNNKRYFFKKYQAIRKSIMRRVSIINFPFFHKVVKDLQEYALQFPFENAKVFYHHGGPFKPYEIFKYDVFENLIEVDFEGEKLMATARYDEYLTQVYGDYMTPPPLNKRTPYHFGRYYWK